MPPRLDGFELNKYNSSAFIKALIANSIIVSYGFITAIDFDTVTVTLAVSSKSTADKVNCTFMNIGNEQFSLALKPILNMRVLVLAPNKAAEGMYVDFEQLNLNEGRTYIQTDTPAMYSSEHTFCIPIMRSGSQAINSLIADSSNLTAEIKHELIAVMQGEVELDLYNDTSIEMHEGTDHFRGCYGSIEETFGMVEGIGGVEKEGNYVYKETYGKFSSVEKNYESGAKIVVGKAYEKPFLTNKGALVDSSAPVTMEFGTGAPVTLIFGDSVVTIKADTETGLDIALTGTMKVSITADTGKFSIGNSTGSLKDILDKIADLCAAITTVGGNVVPGAPYPAAVDPATALKFTGELKTLIAGILE